MSTLLLHSPLVAIRKMTGKPDIDNWAKTYRYLTPTWDLVDRTGQFKFPMKSSVHASCKLPTLTSKHLTYKECCDNRAKEIWDLSTRLNKPIALMWSGGIDSTRALVGFLENFPLAELRDRLHIVCSEYSAVENPVFYQKFVVPNFKLISSENLPWLLDGNMLIVTGELNDELIGTHTLKNYLGNNPDTYKEKFNKQKIFNFVNAKIKDDKVSDLFVNSVIDGATHYGITLEHEADWFWWWNFSFKWQLVFMRLLTIAMPKYWSSFNDEFIDTYIHHFYATEDFQLWAINTPETRVIRKWTEYKLQAKKEIFNFDGNLDYFENKTKRGSLITVFRHRDVAEAVDSNLILHQRLDPTIWYDPSNNFNKI